MSFFWVFYSSKNPEKNVSWFHKNIKQHNCYVSWAPNQHIRKILKDHVTLKTRDMATKNSSITEINYILKYRKTENIYLKF